MDVRIIESANSRMKWVMIESKMKGDVIPTDYIAEIDKHRRDGWEEWVAKSKPDGSLRIVFKKDIKK